MFSLLNIFSPSAKRRAGDENNSPKNGRDKHLPEEDVQSEGHEPDDEKGLDEWQGNEEEEVLSNNDFQESINDSDEFYNCEEAIGNRSETGNNDEENYEENYEENGFGSADTQLEDVKATRYFEATNIDEEAEEDHSDKAVESEGTMIRPLEGIEQEMMGSDPTSVGGSLTSGTAGELSFETQMTSQTEENKIENFDSSQNETLDQTGSKKEHSEIPANDSQIVECAKTSDVPTDEEEQPGVTEPSPLSDFCARLKWESKQGYLQNFSGPSEMPISLKEWKESRRKFLADFFSRRLIGEESSPPPESGNDGRVENSPADDGCSFCSDIMDTSFQNTQDLSLGSPPASNIKPSHATDSQQDSENDDGLLLDTQPENLPPGISNEDKGGENFGEDVQNDSLYSPPLNSQEFTPRNMQNLDDTSTTPRIDGSISGVKRKLDSIYDTVEKSAQGVTSPEWQPGTQPLPTPQPDPNDDDQSLRGRMGRDPKRRDVRGLMWDGNFNSIPHIDDAFRTCSRLCELDFSTQNLDLELCQVLRIWPDVRLTKRIENMPQYSDERNAMELGDIPASNSLSNAFSRFESFEDDGPLSSIYRKVFSIEVAQLYEKELIDFNPISPSVSNFAAAAFTEGKQHIKKETSRKRRHMVKRIKIFFYNGYADVMHAAIQNAQKQNESPILISLAGVPAKCIMPHAIAPEGCHPHLQQYAMNPFGDDDFGVLSPYCICVGDKSIAKIGGERLNFDNTELKLRIVQIPAEVSVLLSARNDFHADDIVITSASVTSGGLGYELGGAQSQLLQGYISYMMRKYGIEPVENIRTQNEDASATVVRDESAVDEDDASDSNSRSSKPSSGDIITRPPFVIPLGNLHSLLLRSETKRFKGTVIVYGVVLGFSPPTLTRAQDWMMSIVLVDESLSLFTEDGNARAQQNDSNPDTLSSREKHVPSVTLILFSKEKPKLPVVRSAGDVVCCQKVVLQEWNGEAQLCARGTNSVVVTRPVVKRCPGDEILNPIAPSDWSLSCNCHAANDILHSYLHWRLINSLYRWGQRRLSTHPTVAKCQKISISQLNNQVENSGAQLSGDLTAVVTSILPTPDHLRRRDTPRGYLRIWDGTGRSHTDPLPQAAAALLPDPIRDEPPEEVLLELEKVLSDKSFRDLSDECDTIEAPIALCGRVTTAIIWEENLWNLIQSEKIITIGSFIRLRNISDTKLPSYDNSISVHSKSSLTPLPHDAYEVKLLLSNHDARIRRGETTNPTSAILPRGSLRSNSADDKSSSLQPIHKFPKLIEFVKRPAPSTFTVQFEIINTVPPCNPSSVDTLKSLCFKGKDGVNKFRFAFHIKDSSAEIDVICLGGVAEKIFSVTARDAVENTESCLRATKTLKQLLVPQSKWEGTICSTFGKDKKIYFILKSLKN